MTISKHLSRNILTKRKERKEMEEQELQPYETRSLMNIEDYAMSVDVMVKQVGLIQDVLSRVMKENEHYGKIPGTQKPTLLKPGAEKLCLLFRLNPDYSIIMQNREEFFISYTVKCTLSHIPTGQIIASGVGACNSRETKYRYRYNEESTERAIPKEYWDARNSGNSKEMKRILGGEGFRAAKINGEWVVAKSQKVENDNPYDLDNTILKMACKRALVAATLNATAASDIFTQDVEDMEPSIINRNGVQKQAPPVSRKSYGKTAQDKPKIQPTQPKGIIHSAGNTASNPTTGELMDMVTPDDMRVIFTRYGYSEDQILSKIGTILREPPKGAIEDYSDQALKDVAAWMKKNEA